MDGTIQKWVFQQGLTSLGEWSSDLEDPKEDHVPRFWTGTDRSQTAPWPDLGPTNDSTHGRLTPPSQSFEAPLWPDLVRHLLGLRGPVFRRSAEAS